LQLWYGVSKFEVQNTDMKLYVYGWTSTRQKNSSMLCKQDDNTLIIYQSCHAIVKQDDSHYMINLAPVLLENMTVTFMDITKCS
jgi:hypothetical protein